MISLVSAWQTYIKYLSAGILELASVFLYVLQSLIVKLYICSHCRYLFVQIQILILKILHQVSATANTTASIHKHHNTSMSATFNLV